MKEIKVYSSVRLELNTQGVDFNTAMALNALVRLNKSKVIEGSFCIEQSLARIISHYFFGSTHERKASFEALILDSDWCSFSAKRKLIMQIIKELTLLDGKDSTDYDKLLSDVMRYRNAFTHGKIATNDKTAWLSYFEGRSQKKELTDDYLTKIETTLERAHHTTFAVEQKIGATTFVANPEWTLVPNPQAPDPTPPPPPS